MTRSAAEKCTPRERQVLAEKQNGLCGCGCGQPIASKVEDVWIFVPNTEDEHTIPNAILKGKPDSIWLKACHGPKTSRDRKVIAKCKRLAGEAGQRKRRLARAAKGQRPLINGAGFCKTMRKKFNGQVEKR